GAVGSGERYGDNYELPNATAYNETCAAIANVYWNQRMFQLHGDSKYIDLLEKILYNGLISGVGLDGKSFFYTNAMQIKHNSSHKDMEGERSGWFDCSCCPTNMTRLLPSLPGYMYAQKGKEVFVNLFINSNSVLTVEGKAVAIIQENNYPWNGDLKFTVSPTKGTVPFVMKVRIPGWARNEAIPSDLYAFQSASASITVITVNGEPVKYEMASGYAVLSRTWKKNDVVEVKLPMEVRRVTANEKLKEDIGKVALQRGPIMYCAEWADNNGRAANIILPDAASFTTEFQPSLLNGIMTLRAEANAIITTDTEIKTVKQPFVAIPYYAWANRGKGEMMVWFPEKIKDIEILSK
ncbi:MAG: glycoside hydrolase family 127 protein, partial [Lacibacter sp.]|nr:glycoside hydrolase family 127 protein [Lacibacter sp.]